MSSDAHPTAWPPHSVLFVCTGNTCRSPLAERLCRRMLADRLGCEPADLAARGFVVRSAGVMAYPGDGASPLAVVAAEEMGAELADHRSRPVTPDLLAEATSVIAMTDGHLDLLAYRFPNVGPPPVPLSEDGDIPDPIGGDIDEYRACARRIAEHLDRFITRWLGS
jgi:protein-tyrosine-phosphatase